MAAPREVERRHPERHRHVLWLLRRVAAASVLAAVGLLVVPPLLARFGLIGPTTEEVVASAAQAVEAARSYGADDAIGPFAQARRELEAARRWEAGGDHQQARDAAARATAAAIEAQRLAIARGTDERQRARLIVEALDRRVEALEDLYEEVTPGLPKEEKDRLFSLMKNAREAAASLSLAFQDGDFGRVIKEEEAAVRVLDTIRGTVAAAKR
ncbi:MAG TPA: hypothetical protein VII13_09425 [Vicinamibacteria bacterium]|jgi:hypothetical protein